LLRSVSSITMTSMTRWILLLMSTIACSNAFNWIQIQNLKQGKTGYYSVGCSVDWDQALYLGATSAQEPGMCMNNCISRGCDVFDVSVSGCSCFKRDMAKNPMPFVDNLDHSPTSKQACGCMESTKNLQSSYST
jgi:hypothetical protein